MPLFTSGGLGLGLVILVLVLVVRIWSCLHHWNHEVTKAPTCISDTVIVIIRAHWVELYDTGTCCVWPNVCWNDFIRTILKELKLWSWNLNLISVKMMFSPNVNCQKMSEYVTLNFRREGTRQYADQRVDIDSSTPVGPTAGAIFWRRGQLAFSPPARRSGAAVSFQWGRGRSTGRQKVYTLFKWSGWPLQALW